MKLATIIIAYLFTILIQKPNIFTFQFDKKLIDRYYLSQSIPHEVDGIRQFLSDGEVYMATGYLYLHGQDPAYFNFEHPPLVKYLFGLSTVIFNNPYFAQILLGVLFLIVFYHLGLKITKNSTIPFLACLFLLADPLFIDISSQPLLDLGQALFLLIYVFVFFFTKNYFLWGVALGLFAGTKFWVTPFFFTFTFGAYKWYKKDLNLIDFTKHLIVAYLTYTLLYFPSFIIQNGHFNPIWHTLKMGKYWVQHNTTTYFGASVILFVTGYFKSWWGNNEIIRSNIWSVIWPIGLVISVLQILKKRLDLKTVFALITPVYLLYLGVQAPFARYFMIVIPFMYLNLASYLYDC